MWLIEAIENGSSKFLITILVHRNTGAIGVGKIDLDASFNMIS